MNYYHIMMSDGSKYVCMCGNDLFMAEQDNMPHNAVICCTGCGHRSLGCAPEVKARAWLN